MRTDSDYAKIQDDLFKAFIYQDGSEKIFPFNEDHHNSYDDLSKEIVESSIIRLLVIDNQIGFEVSTLNEDNFYKMTSFIRKHKLSDKKVNIEYHVDVYKTESKDFESGKILQQYYNLNF